MEVPWLDFNDCRDGNGGLRLLYVNWGVSIRSCAEISIRYRLRLSPFTGRSFVIVMFTHSALGTPTEHVCPVLQASVTDWAFKFMKP